MKILLINNHTRHLPSLSQSLTGHEVEIRNYQPGLDFSCDNKDLIILSGGGGEGLEINDEHKPGHLWYEDQMAFIRGCTKPIIGICMGFEVIARAYGAPVTKASGLIQGFSDVQTTPSGRTVFGRQKLRQFEAHSWRVEDLPRNFKKLATSRSGVEAFEYIEGDKHIFATQFHPEKGGTICLARLAGLV